MKRIIAILALLASMAVGIGIAASPAQACTILPANPRQCI